jgi:hypothetical protein
MGTGPKDGNWIEKRGQATFSVRKIEDRLEKWGQATFCPEKKGTGNFLGQKVACPLFHCPLSKSCLSPFSPLSYEL